MSDLKVALITGTERSLLCNCLFANHQSSLKGASSGIGAATAVHFAKNGYKLALCGRDEAALNRTATQCLEVNSKLLSADVLSSF